MSVLMRRGSETHPRKQLRQRRVHAVVYSAAVERRIEGEARIIRASGSRWCALIARLQKLIPRRNVKATTPPCKCCVPRCRGNCTGDTKVHVFKFPRDQALRDAWIRAVPRENLTVTENSRVCELHLMDADIIRDATHTDQATGRVMTVPLSHVRLRPDAVPSKFPNYSSYLSRKTARRGDPDSKRARIENAALQKAIAESNEAFIRAREEDKVDSLSELANHLRSQGMKFWDVIERNERLLLIHIVDDEAPWLKYSVCMKGDLSVTLHVMKTAVKKLGANLCVSEIANSKRGMVELLEGIEKWDGDLMSNSVAEICEAVCLLLDQLCTSQAEDDANCIRFLKEQVTLHLSKKQRRRYSADFMMFCCILFAPCIRVHT
ncbi:hypothetical protein HPB50_028016 [Hyalomma asiaticum]|nr:hypothetical protein HPB50_028016 [Hyalomma asiaticum]